MFQTKTFYFDSFHFYSSYLYSFREEGESSGAEDGGVRKIGEIKNSSSRGLIDFCTDG